MISPKTKAWVSYPFKNLNEINLNATYYQLVIFALQTVCYYLHTQFTWAML